MDLAQAFGFDRVNRTPTSHQWDDLFGVELELENVAMPPMETPNFYSFWNTHSDQSLRNGVEFVTAYPMGGSTLEDAIDAFYSPNFTYDNGPRTSTHIHVNMTDSGSEVLQSMFFLMYVLEDGLYEVVEESRKWGGYSMPLRDMSTSRIRNLLSPASSAQLINAIAPNRNQERYYGFNTNFRRHGTVEFRYFPGGPSKEELKSWIDFVNLIKLTAKKYTVAQLVELIDTPQDLERFLQQELGEWGGRLLGVCDSGRMFQYFTEVSALASDTDNRELPSSLIFLTPPLLDFVIKKLLYSDKTAVEYLTGVTGTQPVMTKADWNHYLRSAQSLVGGKGMETGRAQIALREQQADPFADDTENNAPDEDYWEPDEEPDTRPQEGLSNAGVEELWRRVSDGVLLPINPAPRAFNSYYTPPTSSLNRRPR